MRVNDLYGASSVTFRDYEYASKEPEGWIESGLLFASLGKNLAKAKAQMRRHARKYGKFDLIIVDYIQAFSDPAFGNLDERQRIAATSSECQSWPDKFGAPVIAVAQLNREAEGGEYEPSIKHHFRFVFAGDGFPQGHNPPQC